MTLDVNAIATDSDLEAYTLGAERLQALIPIEWRSDPDDPETGSAEIARQRALDTVLKALERRRPRILWNQLADATQLRDAVVYGALEILYRAAIDHEDSPNVRRTKDYAQKFADEVSGLQPDLIDDRVATGSLTILISRG